MKNKLIKNSFVVAMAATVLLGLPAQARPRGGYGYGRHYHNAGHRTVVRYRSGGWSTAGHILAGVAIGSVLQSVAQPVQREVVTYRSVYVTPPATVAPAVTYVTVPTPTAPSTVPVAAMRETMWVRNSNGSETPVELRRNGNGSYTGPRGEYYSSRPTNEQLRMLYGM